MRHSCLIAEYFEMEDGNAETWRGMRREACGYAARRSNAILLHLLNWPSGLCVRRSQLRSRQQHLCTTLADPQPAPPCIAKFLLNSAGRGASKRAHNWDWAARGRSSNRAALRHCPSQQQAPAGAAGAVVPLQVPSAPQRCIRLGFNEGQCRCRDQGPACAAGALPPGACAALPRLDAR